MKRKMKKRLLLASIMLFFTAISFAQQRTVTGTVIDQDGSPIANASFVIKGTQTGGVTDDGGNFSISVNGSDAILVFTEVNHQSQEVSVGTQTELYVTMAPTSGSLEEVVVTALGIKKQKASLGYAVQEVSGSVIADAHETNISNSLSGKVSGLQVVKSSNGAGGSSKLVLRGFNSLAGTNQPLIVVDGIPMENFTGQDNTDFFNPSLDYGNGLADLNADDIASISVLKGQTAAALYGSRGGNGVIMITTKTGKKTPGLGITVTSTVGTENIFVQPKTQKDFAQGSNNIFQNDVNTSWGPKIDGSTVTKWDGTSAPLQSHDNLDAFLRNGTSQNYGLSLNQQYGGTAIYSSINYMEDRSIIPGNKLVRTNLSTRAVTKFGKNDRWTSDVKLAYNNTGGFNRPINGKDRSSIYALLMLPRSLDVTDFKAGVDEFGNMLWYPGALSWTPNPYWLYRYNLNHDTRDRFLLNGSLKYEFNDWLSIETRAGADIYSMTTENKTFSGGPLNNSYGLDKRNFSETNYSAMVNVGKTELFGKFGAQLMVGGNLMNQRFESLGASAGSLEVPNLFSIANAQGNPSVSQAFSHKKINSVYGSLELNYSDYLYLTVTDRNDWTTTLIKANRSFNYPSVNLSFVPTNLLIDQGKTIPDWISYVKLRASYATVGNDMAPYQLTNGYSIGKDPLGNTIASRDDLLKNADVVNELLKSWEVGAEMRFLNNRLGLDFTWYKTNATNQLIALPKDPMSGYSREMINTGNIQNEGIEFVFDARILQNSRGLRWNVIANFSTNRNKVLDIAATHDITSYRIQTWEDIYIAAENGQLFGNIYGTKYQRVEDEHSQYFGQLLLDGAGLPVRTSSSLLLGNQQAKALAGITNTFGFRDFTFSFLVDGRFGGKIFTATNGAMQANGTAAITAPNGDRPGLVVEGVIEDGSGGYIPNTIQVTDQDYWQRIGNSGNLGIGEANLYDATNIRLRQVLLGYTLPKSSLGNVFQNVRVSASVNNVWMITSHTRGIDPESVFATGTNAVGFESGAFPTMRSYQLSLTLGF